MNTRFRLIDVESLDNPSMRSSVYWLGQYIKRNNELQNFYRSKCDAFECQKIEYRDCLPITPYLPEDEPDNIIQRLLQGWEPSIDPRDFLDNNTAMKFTVSYNEGNVSFSTTFDINAPRDRLISEFSAFIDHQTGRRKLKTSIEVGIDSCDVSNDSGGGSLTTFLRNLYAALAKDIGYDAVVLVPQSLSGFIDFKDRPAEGNYTRAFGLWLYDYRLNHPGVSIDKTTDAFAEKWPDLYSRRSWNGKLCHRITKQCIAQVKVLPFKEKSSL